VCSSANCSNGLESDVFVGNSLVDMYAKCGSMDDAWIVFSKMPSRNVVTSNAILGGCAMHGLVRKLLNILNRCVKNMYNKIIPCLSVFCQLVAIQVWWMKVCALICFNDHRLYDFGKVGTLHLHS
jgi:pentatricopeptide repeat protein